MQEGNTYFKMQGNILERELDAQKLYKTMYNDLIDVLSNVDTAEILIRDYAIEECIHFELYSGDGQYRYQYSKKRFSYSDARKNA